MGLYETLITMKNEQGNLDFDDITYEQLYILFAEEDISNNRIADLYNVSPSKVNKKRVEWGILQTKISFYRAVDYYNNL